MTSLRRATYLFAGIALLAAGVALVTGLSCRQDLTVRTVDLGLVHALAALLAAWLAWTMWRLHRRVAELRDSEVKYRSLVNASSDGIAIFVLDHVRFANPAALRMLGYASEAEVVGQHYAALLPAESVDEVKRLVNVWTKGGSAEFHEVRACRKDGSVAELEVSASALLYQGEGALQFIVRDVTERNALRRRTAQAAKLAAVGELVAGVAHELNSPLTGIVGYASLLVRQPHSPTQGEDLARIAAEAQRAAGIVRKLLTFARPQEPERRPADVNQLVRDTLDLQSYRLRTSGVAVTMDLASGLPEPAADPQQIQQVLINLVANAEQAIAAAGRPGQLTVATRLAGSAVEIRVGDNGCGIPPEHLDRIFDPFFTTKKMGEGTGLGLSVSYGIIRDHGGEIRVESRLGEGTAFTVVLPLGGCPAAPGERARPAGGEIPSRRWLVVDDEPEALDVLQRMLGTVGQRVAVAASAREALEQLAAEAFDYVVVDVRMPEVDGTRLKAQIEERLPRLRGRVVYCTGDIANPATQALLRSTQLPVIEKPFDAHDVEGAVRRLVDAAEHPCA